MRQGHDVVAGRIRNIRARVGTTFNAAQTVLRGIKIIDRLAQRFGRRLPQRTSRACPGRNPDMTSFATPERQPVRPPWRDSSRVQATNRRVRQPGAPRVLFHDGDRLGRCPCGGHEL